MSHIDFDILALRSLVAGIDLGSFAKASDRIGRSTSAISAQIRKLEEQAGTPLFRKSGRGLALTEAGDTMLAYARRMIELNDEAAVAIRGIDLAGWIRLGMQEDFGETVLPNVLGRFARAHPKVRIEARVARNAELLERIDTNQLDLAVLWADDALLTQQSRGYSVQLVSTPQMYWIGSSAMQTPVSGQTGEPLPLVAFDRHCLFHAAATSALDRAGIAWRLAFTSPSLSGLLAAAAAGLGLTVRTRYGLPATVAALDGDALALPPLPSVPLALVRANQSATPLTDRLAGIMLESIGNVQAPREQVAA